MDAAWPPGMFDDSTRSAYTARNYRSHLARFARFAGAGSPGSLLRLGPEGLQRTAEEYVAHLRGTASPNSIPPMLQGVRHFCVMNDVQINWDKLRRLCPRKTRTGPLRAYTSAEVGAIIAAEPGARNRAIIHLLASTGARIGVFDHRLSVGHVSPMPGGCAAVLLYAGDIEEYHSFLTPQAAGALEAYHAQRRAAGEELGPDSPLFAAGRAGGQLGWSGARSAVYRAVRRAGAGSPGPGGRYDVQVNHGFRKRFNTVLKLDPSVNPSVAEKLMGHRGGLDGTYFVPTLGELFAEFAKVVRRLEV